MALELPDFRGLQPSLRLIHDSNGGRQAITGGVAPSGNGWPLGGLSEIGRVQHARGSPRFDATDVFTLDGEELLACACSPATAYAASPRAGLYDTLTVTDELGRKLAAHRDGYGLAGLVERFPGAVPNRLRMTCDALGRLMQQTDALGQKTAFAYDRLGRVKIKTTRAGAAGAQVSASTYDEHRTPFVNAAQLATLSNPAATIRHDYDANGNRVKVTHLVGADTCTAAAAFDPGGRLLCKTWPDGDTAGSAAAPFTDDAAGRLASIPGHIGALTYDARGNTLTAACANGATTANTFDPARGCITAVAAVKGAAVLPQLAHAQGTG